MRRLLVLLFLALAPSAAAIPVPAQPIQSTGDTPTVPAFVGAPATAHPVAGVPEAWQNPFMAPDPRNSVHNDSWQTDAYTQFAGPLGHDPQTLSTAIGRTCITLVFDAKGRLIGSCTNLNDGPALYLLDPVTLDTLAFYQLPYVPPPAGTNPALNTTGGAYFFLDNRGRVVVAASNRHILVFKIAERSYGPAFVQAADYDPTPCLAPDERMPSALPDAGGRLWFVGRTEGTVGVVDTKTGACRSTILHEEIENSFAVATDGAYIVSDKALYKFRLSRSGKPRRIWRARYANIGTQKTGQINAGSGTTPTLMAPFATDSDAPQFVAITDNADPMHVVVYRAADRLHGRPRQVCAVPVFAKGASATENSLIAVGRSLIVENNYGYDLLKFNDVIAGGLAVGGDPGAVSAPGVTRVEINRAGTGCRRVWTNTSVRAPSVVPKASTRSGLVYLYENVADPGAPKADPWYWTALDYRTGKVRFKVLAGHGGLYNNHYAGIALGRRNGRTTAYLGGVGGIMALRDRG